MIRTRSHARTRPGEVVDADDVVSMIAEQNDRDDPWEGPVPAHVLRYSRYRCAVVPVAGCDLEGYGYDRELAEEYSRTPAHLFPPIVLDPADGTVVDGYHRAHAALLRGETGILALVGIPDTIDPSWVRP
jgi:hypothetical protein